MLPSAILTDRPWLTRAEAATYLRISLRQLDRLRLPRSKMAGARSPRFHSDDLNAAMKADQVRPGDLSQAAMPTSRTRSAGYLRHPPHEVPTEPLK
jgi:hypothetical protein